MTPGDEHVLYTRDRAAWFRHVAPPFARKLVAGGSGSFAAAWPHMAPDYRKAIEDQLSTAERAMVPLGASQPEESIYERSK